MREYPTMPCAPQAAIPRPRWIPSSPRSMASRGLGAGHFAQFGTADLGVAETLLMDRALTT